MITKEQELLFIIDGDLYGVTNRPTFKDINSFILGICKLSFNKRKNRLTVWLRRPGLLIGKGGKTINALKKELDCEIHIKEVILHKSKTINFIQKAMKTHLINTQTKKNKQRLEQYYERMALWVIAKGITHRAIELRYCGTDTLTKLQQKRG